MLATEREGNDFEFKTMKMLLKTLGLSDQTKKLREIGKRSGRDGDLCLEAFNDVYPHFPIFLRSKVFTVGTGGRYRTTSPESIACLVTNVAQSHIVRDFNKMVEDFKPLAGGRPMGLVFPFAGVHGGWILHNGDFETEPYLQRVTIETQHDPLRFERFRNLLITIRASWNPDPNAEPIRAKPLKPIKTPDALDRSYPVPPAIRKLLRNTTAAHVLALLCQLLTRKLVGAQARLIQTAEGERYAVLTLPQIGRIVGREKRCIQVAIAKLQEQNLLKSKRGFSGPGNPNGYARTRKCLEMLSDV
jgi:hypothetical protein